MPKPKLREFGIGHAQSHLVSVSQCCRERKGFTRSVHRISGENMKSETPSPLLRPFTCPAAGASRLTSPLSPQLRHLASTSCLTSDKWFCPSASVGSWYWWLPRCRGHEGVAIPGTLDLRCATVEAVLVFLQDESGEQTWKQRSLDVRQ